MKASTEFVTFPVHVIACPVCGRRAPTFEGGTRLFCAGCLVTAYAKMRGPERAPVWALVPFDDVAWLPGQYEVRPRLIEIACTPTPASTATWPAKCPLIDFRGPGHSERTGDCDATPRYRLWPRLQGAKTPPFDVCDSCLKQRLDLGYPFEHIQRRPVLVESQP